MMARPNLRVFRLLPASPGHVGLYATCRPIAGDRGSFVILLRTHFLGISLCFYCRSFTYTMATLGQTTT
jgi:hypothetical protein